MAKIELPEGDGEEFQRMWQLRPELGPGAAAFSTAVQSYSILSVGEQEAARARIAHINKCIICSQARTTTAEGVVHFDDAFYESVDDPNLRGRYTPREALAIEFAERFAVGESQFDDSFWTRLRAAYTDAEIVDLAASCAKWLMFGRMIAVFGLAASCPIRAPASQYARQERAAVHVN